MKKTLLFWTTILLTASTALLMAQPNRGGRGQGQGQGNGNGRCPMGPPEPLELADMLLDEFDSNQDDALDTTELTEGLTFLRENRRGPRRGKGPHGRRGGNNRGPGGEEPEQGQGQGQGQRGENGNRPGPPSPEDVAGWMIQDHDEDNSGSLNASELVAALQAHRPPRPNCPRGNNNNGGEGSNSQGPGNGPDTGGFGPGPGFGFGRGPAR